MIIHILFPIIIALNCTKVIAAVNSSSLDISRYVINRKPDQPLPKKYILVNFIPESGLKFTSAVYGPLPIWQSSDTNKYIEKAELGLSYCLPQLLTLHLTDGHSKEELYFKWEKGNFMAENLNSFLSYDTILKGNDVLLDTSTYLELDKELNPYAFQKGEKSIAGYIYDVIKPKVDYKLIGIISGSEMVYRSNNSISQVEVLRVLNKPKILIVKDDKIPEPKRFIYDDKWSECDENKAQQFLKQINKEETKTHETFGQQHLAPVSPTGMVQRVTETFMNPPKLYTQQQLESLNLNKDIPSLPTEFVPSTCPDPSLLVLDLDEVSSEFQTAVSALENYSVTTIVPKNGNKILQVNESGSLVWNNEDHLKVNQLVLYKRDELPLLLNIKTQEPSKTSPFFVRKFGKLTKCDESEFNKQKDNWKKGDYDKTICFSIEGQVNRHILSDFNRLLDGIYVFTVKPKDGLELVRVLNGSSELVRPQGEIWNTITVSIFGPTHKILSINLTKEGKNHVKYYDCTSSFEELDNTKHSELYNKFKSDIHIHSDVVYDLSDPKIALYITPMDVIKESVPLSGYHVKMVNMGESVLWKSTKSRCTSVLSVPGDNPTLYKLNINSNGAVSQEYFRIVGGKVLKIKTVEEFEIMKKKLTNNTKNPDNEFIISTIKYDGAAKYDPIVYDLKVPNGHVFSYSTMDDVVSTIYAANQPTSFKEIKFGQKTLWKSPSNSFVTKFVIYYLDGNPALGKLNVVNNGNVELQHYDFTGDSPNLIDVSNFDNKHNEIKQQINKSEIKQTRYNSLDILDFTKIKVQATRNQGVFTADYSLKDQTSFDLLQYGPEIIWVSENGQKAKKASITFYEMVPVIAILTMEDTQNLTKYLSHLTSIWHDFDQQSFDSELKKISTFEPNRMRFTLPDREELTQYDFSSNNDEFFMTRMFRSKSSFITTLLDGRNRVYSPDRFSFIHSLNLYYYGSIPKFVSFREFNLFGYYFEHHFIYSNGWRRITFPKFEQIYNFLRAKIPTSLCKENQFIYDISQGDSKVTVSEIPGQKFGLSYKVNEPGKSICTVRMNENVLWTLPEGKFLTNFYLYKDNETPKLAKFRVEDDSANFTESYLLLKGSNFAPVNYDEFSNALNELIQKNLPSAPSTTVSVTPQPVSQQSPQTPKPAKPKSSTPPSDIPLESKHSPRTPSPIPEIPSGTFALDILHTSDPNFQFKTGKCDKVVPFQEFKPQPNKIVKLVKEGRKVVWFDQNSSLSCLKVFLQNGIKPILMELLLKDSSGKQKYKFVMLDEDKWVSCDESSFDSILDDLIEIYKASSS